MVKIKIRGREYTEKDIMIWILIVISIFAISYAHGLEKLVENIDYELQECQIKLEPQQQTGLQPVIFPDIKINLSEVDHGKKKQ